jgi:hypothetical protein
VDDELVLVLSDIALEESSEFESPDSGGTTGMAFGREGNHLLINGREHPNLIARSGAPQRWRIVNAAKSRYFLLELSDQSFVQIGGDGGLQERPEKTDPPTPRFLDVRDPATFTALAIRLGLSRAGSAASEVASKAEMAAHQITSHFGVWNYYSSP